MRWTGLFILLTVFVAFTCQAAILNVPDQYKEIQQAIDAAADGDTVLVAPGTYNVNEKTIPQKKIEQVADIIEIEEKPGLLIINKEIILASHFIVSGDTSFIASTVISGGGFIKEGKGWKGGTGITVGGSKTVTITGLTIRDANDGIYPTCRINLTHCHIFNTHDGVDFESGSGGYVAYNVIERNTDDALDFDEDLDIVCEYNILRANDDDGIEIRLQAWSGHTLYSTIRNNVISGNAEDGIQFIGYNVPTNRVFEIHDNLFAGNEIAAIACMNDSNTIEDKRGAQLTEKIIVKNNIMLDNEYGIIGGGNMIIKENMIANCTGVPLMNIQGKSKICETMLWNNAKKTVNCNITDKSILNMHPHPEGRPYLNPKWPRK